MLCLHIWEERCHMKLYWVLRLICSELSAVPHFRLLIFSGSQSVVLKKSLQCLLSHWLRRNFGSLLLAVEIERMGSWGRPRSLMHVNNGCSVWAFGFGMERRWEVGECPHLWWDPSRSLLVPALHNLVPKLCGATTQTALLSPAVVFSFQKEKSCAVLYAIKTEATSHSEENLTLCSRKFSALT